MQRLQEQTFTSLKQLVSFVNQQRLQPEQLMPVFTQIVEKATVYTLLYWNAPPAMRYIHDAPHIEAPMHLPEPAAPQPLPEIKAPATPIEVTAENPIERKWQQVQRMWQRKFPSQPLEIPFAMLEIDEKDIFVPAESATLLPTGQQLEQLQQFVAIFFGALVKLKVKS